MDKLGKRILKFCRSKAKDTTWSFALEDRWDKHANTTYAELCQACNDTDGNISSAIEWLVDNKYLAYTFLRWATQPVRTGVVLTHKGLHWGEFQRQEFIKYAANNWIGFIALIIAIISFIRTL